MQCNTLLRLRIDPNGIDLEYVLKKARLVGLFHPMRLSIGKIVGYSSYI